MRDGYEPPGGRERFGTGSFGRVRDLRAGSGATARTRPEPAETPAVELRDDVDYAPIEPKFLLSQHFSAIAAAGPIVGPILAGVMFGWVPALIWILIGSVFIGGVHDYYGAGGLDPPQGPLDRRSRPRPHEPAVVSAVSGLRLDCLVYIIVAFTDITAGSFVGSAELDEADRSSPAAASPPSRCCTWRCRSSWACCCATPSCRSAWATVIFLPLVGVAIWARAEDSVRRCELIFELESTGLSGGRRPQDVGRGAADLLLRGVGRSDVAAAAAAGHLGGYFLYVALGGGARRRDRWRRQGQIEYPAFRGWTCPQAARRCFRCCSSRSPAAPAPAFIR